MRIERKVIEELCKWKERSDRKPLIIQGARQIGKTTAIRMFGKRYYRYFAEFNFDKTLELKDLFHRTKDVKRLIQELPLYTDVPIVPGETLILFDEIQECEEALNTLKYFDEDASDYHIIAAGSLLGVALNRAGKTFPVGKVNFLQMYSVTFREYLASADGKLCV